MSKLLSAVLAVLLIFPVLPVAPAFACGGSHERFVPAQTNKPQIALENLSAEQRAQLHSFAASLAKSIEADQLDLKSNASTKQEVEQRIRDRLKSFRDTIDFATTFEVGNGMLCGAKIKIEMPPRDRDLSVIVGVNGVLFLIRGQASNGTVDEGHLDPGQFLRILDSAKKR